MCPTVTSVTMSSVPNSSNRRDQDDPNPNRIPESHDHSLVHDLDREELRSEESSESGELTHDFIAPEEYGDDFDLEEEGDLVPHLVPTSHSTHSDILDPTMRKHVSIFNTSDERREDSKVGRGRDTSSKEQDLTEGVRSDQVSPLGSTRRVGLQPEESLLGTHVLHGSEDYSGKRRRAMVVSDLLSEYTGRSSDPPSSVEEGKHTKHYHDWPNQKMKAREHADLLPPSMNSRAVSSVIGGRVGGSGQNEIQGEENAARSRLSNPKENSPTESEWPMNRGGNQQEEEQVDRDYQEELGDELVWEAEGLVEEETGEVFNIHMDDNTFQELRMKIFEESEENIRRLGKICEIKNEHFRKHGQEVISDHRVDILQNLSLIHI